MDRLTVLSLAVAVVTGVGLGIQATVNAGVGTRLGPVATGLLVMIAGGIIAGLIFALSAASVLEGGWTAVRREGAGIALAGALAIVAIAGTAYALPRVGVAAGIAAIILGQIVVSILVDTLGIGRSEPVALSLPRLAGVALLGVSVWLLVPRSGG